MKFQLIVVLFAMVFVEDPTNGFFLRRPSTTSNNWTYFNKTVDCDPSDPRYYDPTCGGKCNVIMGPPPCVQLWRRRNSGTSGSYGVTWMPAISYWGGGGSTWGNTNTYSSSSYNSYNNEELAPPEMQPQPTRRPPGRICGCPPQCLAYACPIGTTCSSWITGGVNANTACTADNTTFTAALSYDRIDMAWGCDECRCGHSNTPGGMRCPLSG